MKRLKKAEVVIIALTLAFIFFTAGYFTGRRGSVNIVTIAPPGVTAMAPPSAGPAAAQPEPQPEPPPPQAPPQTETPGPPAHEESEPEEEREPEADEQVAPSDDPVTDVPADTPDVAPDAALNGDAIAEQNVNGGETVPGAPRGGDHRVININTASRAELTDLHGIGDVLAGRIIEYRNRSGGFTRIEDIMNVSGIGPARFDAIRDRITV